MKIIQNIYIIYVIFFCCLLLFPKHFENSKYQALLLKHFEGHINIIAFTCIKLSLFVCITVNIRLVDSAVSQHFAELTQIASSFEISHLLDSPVS